MNDVARELEKIYGWARGTCIPFPTHLTESGTRTMNEQGVTVRNNGKRLALVGGAYLYPGETRQCTRGEYEASKRAGNDVVLVIEESALTATAEVQEHVREDVEPHASPEDTENEMEAPRAQRKNTRARR
jgi:hypothetical protein